MNKRGKGGRGGKQRGDKALGLHMVAPCHTNVGGGEILEQSKGSRET